MNPDSIPVPVSPAATLNVGVAGLGGLGVVGLTKLLALLLQRRYARVVTTESRGIAQRRAPVRSTLRAGRRVRSPQLGGGLLDLMLALEAGEALRWRADIGPGTCCLVTDLVIRPSGQGDDAPVVALPEVARVLRDAGANVIELPVAGWLAEHGHPAHATASVLFGAFARRLALASDECLAALDAQVGNASRAMNLDAFRLGYDAESGGLPAFCRGHRGNDRGFADLAVA